ncbi:MAG: electron transport complex subunit RsxC [Planctomycetia bacterium]|nr:electron transport complex subunit RsxC [Planctomycetia bacterium]
MKNSDSALTFERGVHPDDAKEWSRESAIEVLPLPEELRIPLLQHVGAPTTACVQLRESVSFGQKIAERPGFISANICAPLPGVVKRFVSVTIPNGRHVPAISLSVTRDGENPFDTEALLQKLRTPGAFSLDAFEPRQIRDAVDAAGIVGLGGAAFPTHVKLSPKEGTKIDILLVNGCECEPYLTADYRLMIEAPEAIISGARLAAKAIGAPKVVICVEDNKPDAISSLREKISDEIAEEVAIQPMLTKYPQGGEKQLIFAATGRKVPVGKLPSDVNVGVINVGTAAAVAMKMLHDVPLTHRIISVTGGGIVRPANIFAPIGVSIRELVDYCGGLKDSAQRVVVGGPMMGFSIGSLDIPVTKGVSGITILTHDEIQSMRQTSCVRCGRCVSACPMNLIPTRLAQAARSGEWNLFQKYHPFACIECGCCAFSCPAAIPLVQLIRMGKVQVQKNQRKENAAKK